MDYVQIINEDALVHAYTRVSVRGDNLNKRRYEWLTRNVKNGVLKYARSLVDARFDPNAKPMMIIYLGGRLMRCVTPRDMHRADSGCKRLDVWSLSEAQFKAHTMGADSYEFIDLELHETEVAHLCDALEALHPNLDNWSAISPELAVKKAEQWMQALQRKKLEDGGEVEQVWQGGIWTLVKLLDEDAYKSEGHFMHHCVAGEWAKRDTGNRSTIYSLRKEGQRLVTIEIDHMGHIVQQKAHMNHPPPKECVPVLAEIKKALGWKDRERLSLLQQEGRVIRAGNGVTPRNVVHAFDPARGYDHFGIGVGGGGGAGWLPADTFGNPFLRAVEASELLRRQRPTLRCYFTLRPCVNQLEEVIDVVAEVINVNVHAIDNSASVTLRTSPEVTARMVERQVTVHRNNRVLPVRVTNAAEGVVEFRGDRETVASITMLG